MDQNAFLPLIVFGAGVLSFFAPCIVPLLPVYVGYLSKSAGEDISNQEGKKKRLVNPRLVIQTLIFALGLSTAFVLLGFGAGALGKVINSRLILYISGAIVIILGLHQIGLFNIKLLERQKKVEVKGSKRGGLIGAYLLGLTFSLGWTPCVGPVLATVLGIAGSQGLAVYAAFLMFLYSLGLAIPFILISLFAGFFLERLRKLNKHMRKIQIIGGILIIIMGILLLTDQLNVITGWFTPTPTIS
ncbi:MAG: sulfite exporter TauE/SafE family protein [Clostridiales bacterium]|nr:sulfite exporter TauE/SafE family protein [Clostridiales bacterium]